jgi:TRAP-type C4-dicarboxylate transport system substrate-binding protein
MPRFMSGAVAAFIALSPGLAAADPVNLKLSFFTSDRSHIYEYSVKPFVDAVNAAGNGLVHIDVHFSGAISGDLSRQPQLVADGTADLALVIPGRTPDRFYDTSVLELPGLFHTSGEASQVYRQLVDAGALAGYDDFYVVSTQVSGPEDIHSRKPIASLADLKGLTIRVNNPTEADVLQKLGAVPVLLSINQTTEAMSKGAIDGAAFPPSMIFEFGIGRMTTHHFMIEMGRAPVALVMNRERFENLPAAAQSIIRRYSGEWLSSYSTTQFNELDRQVLKTLQDDGRRSVVYPDPADAKRIHAVYEEVIEQYAGSSDHNRHLFALVGAMLARLRSTE